MYTITVLARRFGLSRSTLLYYDRIGLLSPCGKTAAGYRLYDGQSVARLELICTYKKAGLSLLQIKDMLGRKNGVDAQIIQNRIMALDREVENIRVQQRVLCSLLSGCGQDMPNRGFGKENWVRIMRSAGMRDEDLRRWHEEFERHSPQAHHDFLRWLGIEESQALQIRALTHSIKDNEEMMKYFYMIFENIPRQGPGSEAVTLKAWEMARKLVGDNPVTLDVGCGSGGATLVLAKQGISHITALDSHQPFLTQLAHNAKVQGCEKQLSIHCASMDDMPFSPGSFDLIWAEGSIFIMGYQQGIEYWKQFLRPGGVLALSDLCWFDDNPPAEIKDYFSKIAPGMMPSVDYCVKTASGCGYDLVGSFLEPEVCWLENFYDNVIGQVNRVRAEYPDPQAQQMCSNLELEYKMYKKYGSHYGYVFCVFKNA